MKKLSVLAIVSFIALCSCGQNNVHKVVATYHIKSPGGWDYIRVNNGKIYVSHSSQVNILDEKTGDSIGVILNTPGVHGIAFDNAHNNGFISNGRGNSVTVFNLKTNDSITQIPDGQNPDAIMYEPFSKKIITCNGRSKELGIIDPEKNILVTTIPLDGKPEEPASDGKGKLYVNLEDKNEIVVVDLVANKVLTRYSLSPSEAPSGLAIDTKNNRLFSACSDSKQLVVLDALTGKKIATLPIGDGCDGDAFDEAQGLIYTSNGEGNITVIKEVSADEYKVIETIPTKRGARTIALNKENHTLYLPTADFEAPRKPVPGSFQILVVK